MGRADEIARRVRAAADEFQAMRGDLEDGEPWPLAEDFGPGPEASWGPGEILAHVAEMLPYWLGQVDVVSAAEVQPAPFGRTADDPRRLGAIERDRLLRVGELIDRIETGASEYQRRLDGLDDRDLATIGVHPRVGEMSIGDILERFAAAHAEDHVLQIRDVVGRRA